MSLVLPLTYECVCFMHEHVFSFLRFTLGKFSKIIEGGSTIAGIVVEEDLKCGEVYYVGVEGNPRVNR